MTKYDWGERQGRADYLIEFLGKEPDRVSRIPLANYTHREIIDHIDQGTLAGHEIMGVAGLVLYAMANDPELREKIVARLVLYDMINEGR